MSLGNGYRRYSWLTTGSQAWYSLDDGIPAAQVPAAGPGAVFHEGEVPRGPRLPAGLVDAATAAAMSAC